MLTVFYDKNYFNALEFWSNSCGELYDENHENIEINLLPPELQYVFKYWWSDSYYSSCRLAKYDGKYGIALISVYDKEYIKETGIRIEDIIRKAEECTSTFSEYSVFAFAPSIEPFVNEEPAITLFIPYNSYDIGYEEIEKTSSRFDDICYSIMTQKRKNVLVNSLCEKDKAEVLVAKSSLKGIDKGSLIKLMKRMLDSISEKESYELYKRYVCGFPELQIDKDEKENLDSCEPTIVTVTAIERDGFDVRVLTVNLNVLDKSINVKNAISDACREYITAPEGRRVYENNGNCFNLADFEVNVPNVICRRYGFEKIRSDMADYCLDWDEQLI